MNNVTKIVAAVLVLLAVLLGGYAFVLANKPAPQVPKTASPLVLSSEKTFSVVVADKLLPGGVPIDPSALKVVALPIDPAGGFRDTGELAGKIPKFDIGVGTPVTDSSLVKGLTLLLNEGERAVAVSVDEVVGTGNRVSPGDFVDVFFTLKEGNDISKTQARLLLSRLKVLTYGSASVDGDPAAEKAQNGSARSSNAPPVARTAVLAVPTAEVNRLLLATQNGKLQLVLRHPTDETAPDLALFPEPPTVLAAKAGLTVEQREALKNADNQAFAGAELAGLSGSAIKAVRPVVRRTQTRVAVPKLEQNTVEVVRGTKREVVGF